MIYVLEYLAEGDSDAIEKCSTIQSSLEEGKYWLSVLTNAKLYAVCGSKRVELLSKSED